MAPGRDIHLADLPPELKSGALAVPAPVGAARGRDEPAAAPAAVAAASAAPPAANHDEWHVLLRQWAELKLRAGQNDLLGEALPEFERTLIRIALAECGGQRQEAARRLGWGRNTLTRKIKELGLNDL
jgi:two-component system, NtrC family, nitrogen regulation response regulator GlnG